MIPIAGSAYTYSYATLGEIFAWIIGWDLILEYAVSNMAVAVGFSAYFNDCCDNVSAFICRMWLSEPAYSSKGSSPAACSTCRRFAGRNAAELDPGPRRQRERRRQQRDGHHQGGRRCWFSFSAPRKR